MSNEIAPQFEIATSRQFTSWLAESGASIALTTYQSGKIILIGTNAASGRLSIFERTLERPMGIAFDGKRLAVSTLTQVITFVDAGVGSSAYEGYDAVFVPQFAHFTADLDVHDLTYDAGGKLIFVNTLFSCLATVSEAYSFRPLWRPPFISRLAPEDRCHLNGLAMLNGSPAFATAVGETDVADGWRDHRASGGLLFDIENNEVLCRGFSMPHSPRIFGKDLWLLNSGTGEVGVVDIGTRQFSPVAFCPGYLRGLTFIGSHAVVGLSEPRENKTFAGLPLHERLEKEKVGPRCGICIVNTKTGDIDHWLRIQGVVTELYDVLALPKIKRPMMIGFRQQEIRRTISIES